MKTIWLAALLAIPAQGQNVFLLGSNTALPPDLNGNVQAVAAAPGTQVPQTPVTVNVNVNAASRGNCATPVCGTSYPQYYNGYYPQYSSPNVMYIGGSGTCGPNYYNSYPFYNSSVVYFGGLQAYREGYHFRHCR